MKSILVVDDNKLNLAAARTVLSNDYKVIPVMKGQQALTYLETGECDIILLDIKMPEMDGFEVLQKIRQMEHCRSIPVIFLTADNDVETETRCFREGAVDFITKPFVPDVMMSRIGRALELEELRQSLADRLEQKTREVSVIKDRAQQDALTGLWNREYTEEAVNDMLATGTNGALMMIDIDNFKSINDNYGHSVGDDILKMLADTLRKYASADDVICRIGGDEFMLFVKDVVSTVEISTRAADIIAGLHAQADAQGFEGGVSISIGIARAPENGVDFSTLYSSADKALYHVKRNGKDSYHFFSDRMQSSGEHDKETVNLSYLQELMHRIDSDKGAYLLDGESFRYVYNYIRRFVDRSQKDVSMLLFTIVERDTPTRAIEVLEKMACTFLRRSDVITRYSNNQLVVILMGANNKNCGLVADRILMNFDRAYTGDPVRIDYSVTYIESRPGQRSVPPPAGPLPPH